MNNRLYHAKIFKHKDFKWNCSYLDYDSLLLVSQK